MYFKRMEIDMEKIVEKNLVNYYQETFDELCVINSVVKLVKNSCLEREFSGEYYGIPRDKTIYISEERNNYINMLNILSEKVTHIMNLQLFLEQENLLKHNSYNSCRQVTTQCSTNKRS